MISYEEIRPVIDRLRIAENATVADCLFYLRFEMQEIMKVLPPEVPDAKSDGYHAGCCALRALATVYQLDRLIQKTEQRSRSEAS